MTSFSRLSIRRKVMLAILAGSVTTVGMGGLALVGFEAATYRKQALNTATALAKIVSANSTGALTFHDADTAQEILLNLEDNPGLMSARLYELDGSTLATYQRAGRLTSPPPSPPSPGYVFDYRRLLMSQPVMLNGDRVGDLFLEFDLARERARLWTYAGVVAMAMAVLAAISLLVSYGLQRFVSAPILELARLARHITANNDFSVRAQSGGSDEIGALNRAFNLMLQAIQTREIDLQESRQNLELAQRAGRIASFNWFARTDVFECSDEMFSLFGVVRGEFSGRRADFRKLVHPEDAAKNEGAMHAAQSNDGELNVEYRIIWPDQSIHWMATRAKYFYGPAGEVERMAGVVLDITERKQAEAQLVQQAEALYRSNRELEQFASVSSHDLQEPLRKVASYAELLAAKYGKQMGEEGDRYIGNITDGVSRMRDLIHDLLAYSSLSGEELPMEKVSMRAVVDGILNDLEPAIMEKKAEVNIVTPLPEIVAGRSQMQQLMQNLSSNALKFQKDQAPRIEVGHERRGDDDVFFVRDNGIGIEEIYAERIFKVFQRLHPRTRFPGTGIGLAICKKIVEQHGGRIWLQSVVGEGTTFFFSIPQVKPRP